MTSGTVSVRSGAEIVDTWYTNRSFMIKKAKKRAVVAIRNYNLDKLRKFRQKGNIYIEKNKFNIDSQEEVSGIPYEGNSPKG